ncbi:hypothetical protein AC1031_020406 [Aphanomyces cochlioides]|nr:hypothetical protein AC1031_020406 [Aphanomyces cochlioides]
MTHDDEESNLYEEPGAYSGAPKKSFCCTDDIVLLIAANDSKPWSAPSGTLMKAWSDIAADLKHNRRFGVVKDGQGCKTRFDKLLKSYREKTLAAMRRSGTEEEFGECEQLLEDIIMQDFENEKQERATLESKKCEAIEASGLTMRQLAMESLDCSDDEEYIGRQGNAKTTGSGSQSKRARVVDLVQHITAAVDSATREDPSVSTITTFLKERLEQEDIREEKRAKREDERDRMQHERELARDKQMQDFFVALLSAVRRS